jgi:CO/xanthine dehydrogenase FAD-binding subunit
VHDATVAVAGPGSGTARVDLADLLDEGVPAGAIVTSLEVDAEAAGDQDTAVAVTGRTPADVPIVAAVARRSPTGIRLALTGVADHPRLVDPDHPTGDLTPLGDFRGSGEYRVHLASVLSTRVLQELAS